MTTVALERGQFRTKERAETKKKAPLLNKLGGMVVGFLTEPRGGRHSANYLAAKSGERGKGLARRVLGKLLKEKPEATSRQETPAPQTRTLGPFHTPGGWSAISREGLLGVQSLDDAPEAIANTDDFGKLEAMENRLNGLADNADTLPEVQGELDALADTVRFKIGVQDPFTYINPNRAERLERRGHRFAQTDDHPTQQMQLPATD